MQTLHQITKCFIKSEQTKLFIYFFIVRCAQFVLFSIDTVHQTLFMQSANLHLTDFFSVFSITIISVFIQNKMKTVVMVVGEQFYTFGGTVALIIINETLAHVASQNRLFISHSSIQYLPQYFLSFLFI